MKLAPAGVGAEPKKLALLGGLLLLGGVVYWMENRSDAPVSANVTINTTAPAPIPAVQPLPSTPAPTPAAASSAAPSMDKQAPDGGLSIDTTPVPRRAPVGVSSGGNDTFVPSLKVKDDLDVSKIDPRIHLDLLAKVRAVPLEGGSSSLFDFSKAPEADTPKVAAITPVPVPVPPPAPKPAATAAQSKQTTAPAVPPIQLKYYGFDKTSDGQLGEGLFLEGDPATGNIYSKREGDIIKDRYKVIRIGLKSAELEDIVSHDRQTLKLPEDQQ
jgi:hypothetical protein